MTVEWVQDEQQQHLREVQEALDNMHKELSEEAEKKREQARQRHSKKRGVEMPTFAVGDFVLVAQVPSRANKLALQWKQSDNSVPT